MDHMISPGPAEVCHPTPGIVPRRRGLVLRRGFAGHGFGDRFFLYPPGNESKYPTKNG